MNCKDKEEQCRNVYEVLYELKRDVRKCMEMICQKRDSPLTEKKVLEILGIGAKTLRSYRINGLLGYSKIGNKFFYRMSDIDKMLEKARVECDND